MTASASWLAGPSTRPAVANGEGRGLADPSLAPEAVLGRMGGENFPVALSILPAARRRELVALYGVVRLIDEAGDSAAGDRLALLDEVEQEVDAALDGRARHPLLQRLTPVARAHGLDRGPFVRLIEANRWDQRAPDLVSWNELQAYCALSAAPVGELVLAVFDQSTAENEADAARVCTALQVLEHCQDVAEDAQSGRCYLPREDRDRECVAPEDLTSARAPRGLRRVVAQQVERAEADLERGAALCRRLRGWARLAVAGFVGGGAATASALRAAGFDPNTGPVRPEPRVIALQALRAYRGRPVATGALR